MDLFKALNGSSGPSNPTLIQNNFGTDVEVGATKAIGINEALKILTDNGLTPVSYQASDYVQLRATNNLDSVPEVRATHQAMVASDGMSLLSAPKKIEENRHHTNRRANEEDADIEELGS